MNASPQARIRCGKPSDTTAMLRLLEDAGLPTADLPHIHGLRLWVIEAEGSLQGVIALERFGTHALLRSLAVAPAHRKRGFGRDLVARLEHDARSEGVAQLTLLTETADRFFRHLGYEAIERKAVADEIQQSAEFRSLCPVTAVCMTKAL
jgi:amino-acid N-acetyltransferase